jgi:hypothetical protein
MSQHVDHGDGGDGEQDDVKIHVEKMP